MQGEGASDPSQSPNSYPMTDDNLFPSSVNISISGISLGNVDLKDDPADHRGILSWHNQENKFVKPKNPRSRSDYKGGSLHEAGSYGYLVQLSIPKNALKSAESDGMLKIRLKVDESLPGGLAIYGEKFGRYPLNPTLVFELK
jgi:predicted transcriptional regulator